MKKSKYIITILAILIYIVPRNIYASKMINFENLTIENGLSQATAETIIQDSKGYIWIGTNDGLNRYNGSEIKVLKSNDKNSIISNYITALVEDKNGNLWVGTDQGVSKVNLDDYTIKNYRYYENNKNTPYSSILSFYLDKEGSIYMGSNCGVYLYNEEDDDFKKILGLKDDLGYKNVYSINEDKNNNLWIGTDRGLYKLSLKTKKVTNYTAKYTDTKRWGTIYSIFFDDKDNMWIGTGENGLKKIDIEQNKIQSFFADEKNNSKLKSNSIRNVLQDSYGNIWIATEKGLSKYIGYNKFITYLNKSYDDNTLSNDIVYTLMEDDTGLIWAGTYTGVSIFDSRNKIEIYKNDLIDNNSLSDNMVTGVYEDEEGLLWVGTRDKGINIINRRYDTIEHIYEGNSIYDLSTNAISVIKGKDNIIWVGTRNGINKINKHDMTIEKYTTKDGLVDNNIKGLFIDSYNRLWVGTPKGLSLLDINTNKIVDITHTLIKVGIADPYIQEIYEDKDGIFWIGGYTIGGLIKFNPLKETIKIYNRYENDGEEYIINSIREIVEDHNSNLWIGTNNGLLCFNKKNNSFKRYTEKDGLANNIVYQILIDEENNLWMSTNNGISKFDVNNRFINLSSTDGLQSNEFNGNSAYKCKNGDLVFGGIKGLNIFNPKDVKNKNYEAKVSFDSFEVEGRYYNDIDGEVFEHDKDLIRIKYFITDYRRNNNIQYYYKLKGLSNDWVPITNDEVIFENLPSGKYTFAIKCRNSSGKISEENSVSFRIKPPIWKSVWAIAIYILAIIIIIYNHLNKMKQLDRLVNKRTRQLNIEMQKNQILFDKILEAERSKNNYFINLSHELRTPLNVINSIEQLIRSFCKSEKELTKNKLEDYMNIMRNNTDRLLNLINNIIDASKIENGKYKLNKEKNDIVYIVEEATLSLKESIESSGVELIFDTEVEEKIINCDKYDIERCVINLVSNAQKFTPKGGSISVNIKDLNEFVQIIVKDTGIGIERKYHNIIFDRFNQIIDEHGENKGGSGLGLTITKHIIDLHGGSIYVESEKNEGCKFTIILPVK